MNFEIFLLQWWGEVWSFYTILTVFTISNRKRRKTKQQLSWWLPLLCMAAASFLSISHGDSLLPWSHPIPISNCANTYAPTISSLPSYIGNGIASYFWQTGDVHLVIGSNKHWCQPLDGCSPFAEKNSLFRCLFIYLPLLKRIRGVPIPTFFLWLRLLILLQLEKLFGASPPPNVNSQMLLL